MERFLACIVDAGGEHAFVPYIQVQKSYSKIYKIKLDRQELYRLFEERKLSHVLFGILADQVEVRERKACSGTYEIKLKATLKVDSKGPQFGGDCIEEATFWNGKLSLLMSYYGMMELNILHDLMRASTIGERFTNLFPTIDLLKKFILMFCGQIQVVEPLCSPGSNIKLKWRGEMDVQVNEMILQLGRVLSKCA